MPTITTTDGRTWGYGRYGRLGGRPVLLHHGLMGNANLGSPFPALGEQAGLEWIIIERPGYGDTPPVDMDRIFDWPDLMTPVLDALGITGSFDAVGISAGAPYAYALAAGLPGRVRRVAILSGVPFLGAAGVLDAYPKEAQAAYARYVVGDDAALRAEFRTFCQGIAARLGDSYDLSDALASILRHDAAGPAREARLQARDWGFDREAVTCPVDLWHSKADDMVPFPAARLSAEGLPGAVWHVQEEPSHFSSEASLKAMVSILALAED